MALAPFAWFGGKQALATRIAGLLPPHLAYIEPFGGGASVLFAKGRSRLEVYNDVDEIVWRRSPTPDRLFTLPSSACLPARAST